MRPRSALPPLFRSLGIFKILNVAGVGFSLAAGITAVITPMIPEPFAAEPIAAIAMSTTLVAMVWAFVVRDPRTVLGTPIRVGWVATVPLAIANAALTALLFQVLGQSTIDLRYVALATTAGAVFWIPGLIASLVCFGAPMAWAQVLAARGLAGQEKGERAVGLACVVVGLASMALVRSVQGLAPIIPTLLGAAGACMGAFAILLASIRGMLRRRFVAGVEGGRVRGYRIDVTEKGRVLLRVASERQGYRAADVDEELAVFEPAPPRRAVAS